MFDLPSCRFQRRDTIFMWGLFPSEFIQYKVMVLLRRTDPSRCRNCYATTLPRHCLVLAIFHRIYLRKFVKMKTKRKNFYIFILSRFCKNIWSGTNFAKISSGAMAHGVKDITSWAATLGAARSGPLALTPRATALRPWRRGPRR
jgi:hypothetical protein